MNLWFNWNIFFLADDRRPPGGPGGLEGEGQHGDDHSGNDQGGLFPDLADDFSGDDLPDGPDDFSGDDGPDSSAIDDGSDK